MLDERLLFLEHIAATYYAIRCICGILIVVVFSSLSLCVRHSFLILFSLCLDGWVQLKVKKLKQLSWEPRFFSINLVLFSSTSLEMCNNIDAFQHVHRTLRYLTHLISRCQWRMCKIFTIKCANNEWPIIMCPSWMEFVLHKMCVYCCVLCTLCDDVKLQVKMQLTTTQFICFSFLLGDNAMLKTQSNEFIKSCLCVQLYEISKWQVRDRKGNHDQID